MIDDEPFLRDAVRRSLSGDHVVVVAISEAAEALTRLEEGQRYDLILCDLMMPGMDGIEFHRRLSLVLPQEAAKIVFITGGATTARVEAFFRRVPNTLLEKPLDLDELRTLIEQRSGRAVAGGA